MKIYCTNCRYLCGVKCYHKQSIIIEESPLEITRYHSLAEVVNKNYDCPNYTLKFSIELLLDKLLKMLFKWITKWNTK